MTSANRVLALVVLLAVAWAAPSWAGLSWRDCAAAGGVDALWFDCDTNEGTEDVVVTFTAVSTSPIDMIALEVLIRSEYPATLPDWWRLGGPDSCRGGLRVVTDFSVPPYEDRVCANPWGGGASRTELYWSYESAQLVHLMVLIVGPSAAPRPGEEHYACVLRIPHAGTTGPGACGGCADPVRIELGEVFVQYADGTYTDTHDWSEACWQEYCWVRGPQDAAGSPGGEHPPARAVASPIPPGAKRRP
jgi:hypothetical protein